jgi:hypothetical protein
MRELGLDAVGASSASSTSSQRGEAAPGDPTEIEDLADFDEIETADQPNETQDPEEQTTTPTSTDATPNVAQYPEDSGTGNGATGMDDERTDELRIDSTTSVTVSINCPRRSKKTSLRLEHLGTNGRASRANGLHRIPCCTFKISSINGSIGLENRHSSTQLAY